MNCREFQADIYEYLDGTLPPQTQAAMEKHVAVCQCCQRTLNRQRQLARTLSDGLHSAASSLKLSPKIRDEIQSAVASELSAQSQGESVFRTWSRRAWPIALAASIALAACILTGNLVLNRNHSKSVTLQSGNVENYSIDVSYVSPTYTFQRQDGMVLDTLDLQTNVVNMKLWATDHHKPESKTQTQESVL